MPAKTTPGAQPSDSEQPQAEEAAAVVTGAVTDGQTTSSASPGKGQQGQAGTAEYTGTMQFMAGARALTQTGEDGTGANMLVGVRQIRQRLADARDPEGHPEERVKMSLLSGMFNFAGTRTISGSEGVFGTQLLDPSIDARGVNIRYGRIPFRGAMKKDSVKPAVGYYGRAGISFHDWQGTPAGGEALAASGQIAYASAGLQFAMRGDTVQRTAEQKEEQQNAEVEFSFGAELGLTYRSLLGDIASDDNEELRLAVIGSNGRSFWGCEGTFFVNMGDLRPYVRVTHFPGDISGFSGTQVVMGIDALTPLFATGSKAERPEPESKAYQQPSV